MNWFPDMFWLFTEWAWMMLLPLLAGLALGWWFWRRPWISASHNHNTEIRKLGTQRSSLEAEVERLNGSVGKSNGVISGLKSDLNLRSARVGELEPLLSKANLDRDGYKSRLGDLELDLDGKTSRIVELESNLNRKSEVASGFETELLDLRSTLSDTSKGKKKMSADLDASRAKVDDLEGKLVAAEKTKVQGFAGLESDISSRNTKISDLEGRLTGANAKVGDLQGKLSARDSAESALSTELKARKARIANLESEIKASGTRVEELDSELGVAKSTISGLASDLSTSIARAASLESRLETVTSKPEPVVIEIPESEPAFLVIPGADDAFSRRLSTVSSGRDLTYRDDLKEIKGVGPKMESVLNTNGLTTFYQVALLDDGAVDDLEARIETFPGRVRRDDWVPQAGQLHTQHHSEELGDRVVIPWYERPTGEESVIDLRLAEIASERDVDYTDNLKPIVGIGQKVSTALAGEGITNHYQLALLDDRSVDDLEERIAVRKGRIRKENWIPQAAQLHFETHGEEIYDLTLVEGTYDDEFERQLAESSRGVKLDYTDDLTEIKGVGKKMNALLTSQGISTFLQVSRLDTNGVAALNARLDAFPGRIERDSWVMQADELHATHHG